MNSLLQVITLQGIASRLSHVACLGTSILLLTLLTCSSTWAQSSDSAPALADLDGDGDKDAVVGTAFGTFLYYKNVGSAVNPLYVQQSGTSNPFNGQFLDQSNIVPTLGDIDGDGDQDAVVGTGSGSLLYYQNVGSAVNPLYVQQYNNPFETTEKANFYNAAPSLADLDGDGDLDAVVGTEANGVIYYQNVGSAVNPLYVQQSSANPFGGQVIGEASNISIALGDVDGDGDLDAIAGYTDGTLNYLKNTGSASNPLYVQQSGINSPFIGTAGPNKAETEKSYTKPSLADLDGDGDLDLVVGTGEGSLLYFKNTGSVTNPLYVQQFGAANPFQPDLTPILYVSPSVWYGNTNFHIAVDVMELNGTNTSGTITLYITKDSKMTLTFDPTAVSLPGYNGTLQNSQWQFDATSNAGYYILTTQSEIGSQGKLSVGLSGKYFPAGTRGTLSLSAVLAGGSGGEGNSINNIDAEKVNYFER